MIILDGVKIAKERTVELIAEFDEISKIIGRKPILSIIQVGDDPASSLYIRNKIKKAEQLGVEVILHKYDKNISQNMLLKKLDDINEKADGIVVQLPLPDHISPKVIMNGIRLEKDVDGLCEKSTFSFYNDKYEDLSFTPATAAAIMDIINYYKLDLNGKKVAVIGRSYLVGKPAAFLIKKLGANVSTYNRNTGIKGIESADLVVSAAGHPNLVKNSNVKEGAWLIDAGISLVEKDGGKVFVGDANFNGDYSKLSGYTPVPGGVGSLTVIWLFKNLAKAIKHEYQI
ncbi:bifunctional 5,10-methylenetetrahydrofolate dehydrogenase/5,10-methenyltetrahydrofolate cyclohydrolase [Mycoplasma tauri]|uniref:Bifunctional protein FolD n=1 Tax=Mycoplasma tauri TaxID=547987 RepID=A0A953NCL5_9MOLU|nr:bifunctional 5,10-methylenetetrahydrofolate dehydrogenase/5,10-methenyltetrahydrofolate cyclohydrolase [Mycoplasma tauri]MBZ4195396.1 bifunctional 5,10-methylenetetrahydrofolate dehydrogenase/5,10-methenyltetrahydrofolate cyclohydrolase [Mycoplasma tauri]MBZ4203873.1 bifunctional 5,10-methylenetetrahydrofolate dehydrogenase/5,10-methenyltetrahydrofolate cyclohydrolase [Mycoplasma tauri]MBZ4204144.1 bifunctional 5,10-methylenetetrahydrofolate dehydrogenase/5,10-methenyltetrahydrofolate cyclohy